MLEHRPNGLYRWIIVLEKILSYRDQALKRYRVDMGFLLGMAMLFVQDALTSRNAVEGVGV